VATSSPPPPVPNTGDRVLHYLQELRRWLKKNNANVGAGLSSRQTADGRIFSLSNLSDGPRAPWELFQVDALEVSMETGLYTSNNATTAIPTPGSVDISGAFVITDNATTYFWVTVPVSTVDFGSWKLWTVGSLAINSGATVPDHTADLSNPGSGSGDLHIEIGSVAAASGALTFTQELDDRLQLVFPLVASVETITVQTDYRYDTSTLKLQKKTRSADVMNPTAESGWTDVYTAKQCT